MATAIANRMASAIALATYGNKAHSTPLKNTNYGWLVGQDRKHARPSQPASQVTP